MEDRPSKSRPRRRDTTDSRAERKRELDRLAQRATRERTKNRITFLEQKLASLESCDRQGEIANLTKVIDELRTQNSRLQSAMMKMRFSINEALGDIEAQQDVEPPMQSCGYNVNSLCVCRTSIDQSTSPDFSSNRHHSVASSGDSETVIEMPMNPPIPITTNDTMVGMMSLDEFFNISSVPPINMFEMPSSEYSQWQPPMPSPYDFQMPPPNQPNAIARDLDKWHVSNSAFINCMDLVKKRVATNAVLDLHVPFKAAIWGWDSVGADADHPVWVALRQVDQKVFGTWTSKAQRIALMYVCQTLLQYRENPTKENLDRVPVWFRPRPAQERVQHPAVIDFLIWPGLRDRLVFEHEKYTRTGDFSAAFVNYFDFHWPHSDREIFAFNPALNRYEVSKMFLDYAYSFKNWTMKPEFFKKFPEMQHDIAATGDGVDFTKTAWTE